MRIMRRLFSRYQYFVRVYTKRQAWFLVPVLLYTCVPLLHRLYTFIHKTTFIIHRNYTAAAAAAAVGLVVAKNVVYGITEVNRYNVILYTEWFRRVLYERFHKLLHSAQRYETS